jgi:predicted porin
LVQWGGYDQGNGTGGLYQGQAGADVNLFQGSPYGGTLSTDFIGSWAKDVVNVGTFSGSCTQITKGPFAGQATCASGIPTGYSNTDVTATLSNNTGFLATAKYKVNALTVFGGYAWLRQANPSDDFLNGFETIGGWNVPATINQKLPGAKAFPTAWTNFTNFNVPRIAPYFWVGAKYAITPQLDVTGAYYYLQQSNFNTTACTGITNTFTEPNGNKFSVRTASSNKCAGTEDAFSALIDWRPVKRVDLYAGLMVSNVYGGLANGFQAFQNIAPTAGLRVKF